MLSRVKRLFKKPSFAPAAVPQWLGSVSNKEKLTIEDAKFIFEQAEKILADSVTNSEDIVDRTGTLITLLSGALIAFASYIIANHNAGFKDKVLDAAIAGSIYSFILVFVSFENTKPRIYQIPGSLPKDLFVDAFFVNGIQSDKRIIHFYVSEFENYQFRIETNSELNKIRWRRYKYLQYGTLVLPLILLLTYWVCYLLL